MEISYMVQQLEFQAEWRHGKAEEYPDDSRNLEAAEDLERLAKEVADLTESDIVQRIESLWGLAREKKVEAWRADEWFNEQTGGIGFRTHFKNGTKLLEAYCEKLEDDLRCRHNDDVIARLGPSEDDLVDQDEAVKAAEHALDTARKTFTQAEKAYQEARTQARARLVDRVGAEA
jgi:hypothetical protein